MSPPTDPPHGIDIETEDLLTPAEAARHPVLRNPNGQPCRLSKIYRLFTVGVRGVTLENVRVPGGLRTSREAVARFIEKLNRADGRATPVVTSTKLRQRAAVDRELDQLLGV
jgi:hypothetical protein